MTADLRASRSGVDERLLNRENMAAYYLEPYVSLETSMILVFSGVERLRSDRPFGVAHAIFGEEFRQEETIGLFRPAAGASSLDYRGDDLKKSSRLFLAGTFISVEDRGHMFGRRVQFIWCIPSGILESIQYGDVCLQMVECVGWYIGLLAIQTPTRTLTSLWFFRGVGPGTRHQ